MTGQPLLAVVFDMDGVLVDTEPAWRAAEVEVFADLGIELTETELVGTTGLPVDRTIALVWGARPGMAQRLGRPDDAEIARRVEALVLAHVRSGAQPMPGVDEAMALVTAMGLQVAIASASAPTMIDAVCAALDLAAIGVRCSSAEEAAGKPAPDVYLTAARRLGLSAGCCLGIEDSPTGVLAVKAAGMRCLAVPDPWLAADPTYQAADVVLPSLTELTRPILCSLGAAGEGANARP